MYIPQKQNSILFELELIKSLVVFKNLIDKQKVQEILELKLQLYFNSKISKRFDTKNCCYELKMSGKQNVIHLLSILYDNSSIYLDRKYNKYLDFIK